ncbi:hypothetical protein [Bacteroides gallinarum]|uniref:hypothetical protein n=1 Tax=Bacteroides gallinarum TaxID=376806 RepID=UPI001427E37A|nr:hypothetical protein [Bacteroides gallinarum]
MDIPLAGCHKVSLRGSGSRTAIPFSFRHGEVFVPPWRNITFSVVEQYFPHGGTKFSPRWNG